MSLSGACVKVASKADTLHLGCCVLRRRTRSIVSIPVDDHLRSPQHDCFIFECESPLICLLGKLYSSARKYTSVKCKLCEICDLRLLQFAVCSDGDGDWHCIQLIS